MSLLLYTLLCKQEEKSIKEKKEKEHKEFIDKLEREKIEKAEKAEREKREYFQKVVNDFNDMGYCLTSYFSKKSEADYESQKRIVLNSRMDIINEIIQQLSHQNSCENLDRYTITYNGVMIENSEYKYVEATTYYLGNDDLSGNIALKIVHKYGFSGLHSDQWVAIAMAIAETLHKMNGSIWGIREGYDGDDTELIEVKLEKVIKEEPFC